MIRQRGFSLIELLVTVLILSIGLLGTATLTLSNLQSQSSAYQRTQAGMLAFDLGERLRGQQGPPSQVDWQHWLQQLDTALPGARAQLKQTGVGHYHISIDWQEANAQSRSASLENRSLSLQVTL